MNSINRSARMAGLLIVIIAFIGPFSMLYVPATLVVPGDAASTAHNILTSGGLFRWGMAADAAVFLMEIGVTVLLYMLIRPVNKTLALITAFARLAMTIIQGLNLVNHFIVLLLLSGATYLTVWAPEQLQALALVFLNAHAAVVFIWGLFFGLHLVVLGYLVYQSSYIPRLVGGLLIIAGLCYFAQDFGNIVWPQYADQLASIGFLSIVEIALPLWLLIKGVNLASWEKRNLESTQA